MASRVVLLRCAAYEKDLVSQKIHEALGLIGGISSFVEKGQTVLLKPNMLSARGPEHGITTHPLVLEAMIDEVRSVGGHVRVGDSPSGGFNGLQPYWEKTGFGELCERMDVELVDFETGEKEARLLGGQTYLIARAVLEADVVINLPKLKTHGFTLYTGAIKNIFGVLPGFQKVMIHKRYPHPGEFSRILAELYATVPVRLTVIDGIRGMAGNGPATGVLRDTGLLLAGEDGVALDAVASHLMGFKPEEIDAIRISAEMRLGENRLEHIDILGENRPEPRFEDFPLPSNRLIELVPSFLVRWLGRFIWVRPTFDPAVCTGCELCVRNCPVGAIRMSNGVPVADFHVCINCLCCNECCPEGAAKQECSRLAKLFG